MAHAITSIVNDLEGLNYCADIDSDVRIVAFLAKTFEDATSRPRHNLYFIKFPFSPE